MDRVMQFSAIQNEAKELFKKKNQDYGDAFANYGPVGVLVRMGDKIGRLQSISKSGIQLVNDERLRDTLMDLHNYSAMAIMLMDEEPVNKTEPVVKTENEPVVKTEDEKIEEIETQMPLFCKEFRSSLNQKF